MSKKLIFGDMTTLIQLTIIFGITFILCGVVFYDALSSIYHTAIFNINLLYNF